MNKFTVRLHRLREEMKKEGYDSYLITGTDPHQSEYMAPRWQTRQFLTGFTGSAGTVLLTATKAGLWTDSRYYLQAEKELLGSDIELFRAEEPQVPSPQIWLANQLSPGESLGVDGTTTSWTDIQQWEGALSSKKIKILVGPDLLEGFWEDRPLEPGKPLWDLESTFPGLRTRRSKLADLRTWLNTTPADFQVLCTLDDIAWLTNLRGEDVAYNPLFLAFALVDDKKAELYLDVPALSPPLAQKLAEDGWAIKPYRDFYQTLALEPPHRKVYFTPGSTNGTVIEALGSREMLQGPSPTTLWKAQKDEAELKGIRRAHLKDGLALVKFLAWFQNKAPQGLLTEGACSEKLRGFRSLDEDFLGESFETIPGWKGNGAIVHYGLGGGPGASIQGSGLFLLDSGGQYLEGTTDVTRTLCVGTPTEEEKRDYTLVLKAHLALARTPFPRGTRGYQLDGMTRSYLWSEGINYGHGTGHGVGHVLCVHEGPQRINPHPINQTLELGMVLSNEPGVYRKGKHGIRIENLQVVIPSFDGEFGQFYQWETLTLAPYEARLINVSLLTPPEINQINLYHHQVWTALSPGLNPEEKDWLLRETTPLRT